MMCQNCNKAGHIASLFNSQVADTKVPKDVHKEASHQLLNTVQQEADNHYSYYANLFLCEDQEHRSASFQTKDVVNGGQIPKE
jgi:hypothetical protein